MTTTTTTTTAARFQLQVLAGVAAGEVKRVKIGNATHVEWYRSEGFNTKWGRVYTRRPIASVAKLLDAGLISFSTSGKALLTRAGKKLLATVGE